MRMVLRYSPLMKKLMDEFTLDDKAELAVNMDRFFILFIDNQIQLIQIKNRKTVVHGQPRRARVARPFPWKSG